MAKPTPIYQAPNADVAVAKTPSLTDPAQTLKASQALLAHIRKKHATEAQKLDQKKSLLAEADSPPIDSTPIWLTLTTKKHIHDTRRLQPGKIVLPYALNRDPETTVCLITVDPQRAYKNVVASEGFPEELRKRITRVVDVAHLQSKFKTFEAQRKLLSEHDVFLADDRIVNRLPKALGKTFYKSTVKRPIPVVLMPARPKVDGKRVPAPKGLQAKQSKRDTDPSTRMRPAVEMVAEIERALGAALVHLSPSTNTSVKVGFAGWPVEEVAANVERVSAVLVDKFIPQKWKNVRSIYIKGPETVALPIWQTDELWADESQILPDTAKVEAEEAKKKDEVRANVGKKRKPVGAAGEGEGMDDSETPKPGADGTSKRAKTEKRKAKKAKLPESDDTRLDKQVAARKAMLKKQKEAAKRAAET